MSNALSLAINGINSAVSLASQSATNIVNASSTGQNTADIVNVKIASTDMAANAAVIKTVAKMNKALLDIKV